MLKMVCPFYIEKENKSLKWSSDFSNLVVVEEGTTKWCLGSQFCLVYWFNMIYFSY